MFPTFPVFSRPSLRNGAIVLCCSAFSLACGCVSQSEHTRVTTERDQFATELAQAKSAGDVSRKHGEALELDLEVGHGQLEASEKAREELSGRLTAADKRAAALAEALQSGKAELAELGRQRDKEAADAQTRLAEAQTALTDARNELARAGNELTTARNDLAVAKHDLASAEQARKETAEEGEGLRHKSEQLAADLGAAKSRSAELEKKLTAAEAGLADARSALASSQAEATKGQSDLNDTRQQLSHAEQAAAEAHKVGDEARQAAEKLRKDLTESRRQAAEFKATLDGDAAELTRLRAQAETAKDASKQADVKEPTE